MKKKKTSSAGSLFYVIGTILLIAVLIVCIMNFLRDGRLMGS